MNKETKEFIKKGIKSYENSLEMLDESITCATKRLTSLTEERKELLLKIKQLKEDLVEETTEI